ncbi:hypothetical protein RSOLAG22IIIB_11290 [Rhizoctonia solani]|uniref:No apical meristem-associated C-terminal domain-containing protein n=1 Tax=Rhizoctonia solani TaxID=456999 RepID=A0A0K6G7H0_9AGAM|nr:hypothetical protein RSOLAG22IIIB_11290 [Rhizoctonia solani]
MIGATATANPFAAPHGKKTDAWNAAVAECNNSGFFPFSVTKKGLQDKITWLLNSLEKPRKTKFGETQSRNYNSEIDNLRKLRQDAETDKESVSAKKFEKAQRQDREGQVARDAALQTWRESQAEHDQSPDNSGAVSPTTTANPRPSCEPSADPHAQDGQNSATPSRSADPTAVLRQLVKSTRQINQSEGARFERMHGNIATSTELLQGISEQLGELKVIGEETNALLRAVLSRPPPPMYYTYPDSYHQHLGANAPGAGPGPSTQTQAQKRQRME